MSHPSAARAASNNLGTEARYLGVDQRFSPRLGFNVLYNYYNQGQLPRGTNLNPVVNGVRVEGQQILKDGDIISFGGTHIRFEAS